MRKMVRDKSTIFVYMVSYVDHGVCGDMREEGMRRRV